MDKTKVLKAVKKPLDYKIPYLYKVQEIYCTNKRYTKMFKKKLTYK